LKDFERIRAEPLVGSAEAIGVGNEADGVGEDAYESDIVYEWLREISEIAGIRYEMRGARD
jgi:hypothetical protein